MHRIFHIKMSSTLKTILSCMPSYTPNIIIAWNSTYNWPSNSHFPGVVYRNLISSYRPRDMTMATCKESILFDIILSEQVTHNIWLLSHTTFFVCITQWRDLASKVICTALARSRLSLAVCGRRPRWHYTPITLSIALCHRTWSNPILNIYAV